MKLPNEIKTAYQPAKLPQYPHPTNTQPVVCMYAISDDMIKKTELPPVLPPYFPNTIKEEPNGGIVMEGALDRFSKVLDRIEQAVEKVASEVSNLQERIEKLEEEIEVREPEPTAKVCPNCEGKTIGYEDELGYWYECPDCGLRGPTKDTAEEAAELWNEIIFYEMV